MKVALIVPTLNEIQGVREIMPRLKPEWYDEIIVVDGGSTDGTVEYLRERGYPLIIQQRPGFRNAYREALGHIGGDIVVTFSPDGNSIPKVIPALIAKIKEGYDMVIASRYMDGARSEDDDFVSGLANKVFTFTINMLFRARYTDAMVIFRAYKRSLISDLKLDEDSSYWPEEALLRTRISWEPLLSVRSAKRKLKVAEIPGSEPCRIGGRRKLHAKWGLAFILELFREFFFWR